MGDHRIYLPTAGSGASAHFVIEPLNDRIDELEHIAQIGRTADLWNSIIAL